MKTKWLTHARQNANYYIWLEALSLWLQETADVLMTGKPNARKPKWTNEDNSKNSSFSIFSNDNTNKGTA